MRSAEHGQCKGGGATKLVQFDIYKEDKYESYMNIKHLFYSLFLQELWKVPLLSLQAFIWETFPQKYNKFIYIYIYNMKHIDSLFTMFLVTVI